MKTNNLLKNLLLTLVSTIVTLVVIELAARQFHTPVRLDFRTFSFSAFYDRDDLLGWKPRPNLSAGHTLKGSFDTTFRTNSRGLRDREYPYEKPAGVRRIAVMGDSYTWGFGVNDDEIFTELLERDLPHTEVINFGVSGYGLRQEFLYLKSEGMRYSPDVVVVALSANDLIWQDFASRSAEWRVKEATKKTFENKNAGAAKDSVAPTLRFKRYLRDESALYNLVVSRINTSKKTVKFLVSIGLKDGLDGFENLDTNLAAALRNYPESLERDFQKTETELVEIHEYLRARGVRLVVALVPALQSIDPKAFQHTIAYSVFDEPDFDLDKPYARLGAFLRARGIDVVNPVEAFRLAFLHGENLYLFGDSHFTPSGHKNFARELARALGNAL